MLADLNMLEINLVLHTVVFVTILFTITVLFNLIKRTKDEVRQGLIFLIFAMTSFLIYEIFQMLYNAQVFSIGFSSLFLLIFGFFLIFGFLKIKTIIRDISDLGQAFVIVSKKHRKDKIISILKNMKNVCYISLDKPVEDVVSQLEHLNFDYSSYKFVEVNKGKCDESNCYESKNNPEEIKNILSRILREEKINCVIIDGITNIKGLEKFEIPIFVQETASLIKANESQGFFIEDIEKIDKQMINDISMLVDKVIVD